MEEKKLDLTKGYIPVLTAVGMILAVGTTIFFTGSFSKQIEMDEQRIEKLENQMAITPTRTEYEGLKETIAKLSDKIDKILEKLSIK